MKTSILVAMLLLTAGAPAQQQGPASKPDHAVNMQNMKGMAMDGSMDGAAGGSIDGSPDGSAQAPGANGAPGPQEPENPSHRTGSNLPAPDLLKDVATEKAMAVEEFLTMADKTNPTLAQANANVRRAEAQAQQAGLYPNPGVGYQGEQIRGGSYAGGEQGGFVQQTVVLGGKLGLRRDIYNEQSKVERVGMEEQTYRVHGDVMQAFYTALTAQAKVVVRQRLMAVATDAVETVRQLANVGQADAPDILETEVEAEQAKIDFVTAQREFLQDFHGLAVLCGQPRLTVHPLAGMLEELPQLDAEQQVVTIVGSSPEVKRRQQEIAVSEARLRDARRESVPDLQLKAGEQYNFEHLAGTPGKATGPQSFATAAINIPLWNRNQGNISAAQVELERSREEMTRTRLALEQAAKPLAQSYTSARFTADRYRTELIPRAQRAYQLYLNKYENLAMAYPQVLVSQRTLFQLQIGYLNALHEVWRTSVALENYTLSGGLDAPRAGGSSPASVNPPYSPGFPE